MFSSKNRELQPLRCLSPNQTLLSKMRKTKMIFIFWLNRKCGCPQLTLTRTYWIQFNHDEASLSHTSHHKQIEKPQGSWDLADHISVALDTISTPHPSRRALLEFLGEITDIYHDLETIYYIYVKVFSQRQPFFSEIAFKAP